MLTANLMNELADAVGLTHLPGFTHAINGELAVPCIQRWIALAREHNSNRNVERLFEAPEMEDF